MNLTQDIIDQLFAHTIRSWNVTFGGVSGLDLADKLEVPHEDVMRVIESWVEAGRGTMNANVKLGLVSFPEIGRRGGVTCSSVTTHIFFPSREVLTESFYSSGKVRTEPAEYKKRLMCGEHQLALCFFSEEVLARYYSHPDWYEVDDSTAGGHIRTKSDSPPDRRVDVKFGKGKSHDGRTFVTAIYKDLYLFSESEQRHWHAHEIDRPKLDESDKNFQLFTARTYDGALVDFPKPIEGVQDALRRLNQLFSPNDLFGRLENEHLRMPVENTNKALADSCSEIYKVVGTDSLKAKPLLNILQSTFGKTETYFSHASGRPLSALQLLEGVETELGLTTRLSVAIKSIAKHRIDADHKVIATNSSYPNYGEEFILLCNQVIAAAENFAKAVEAIKIT